MGIPLSTTPASTWKSRTKVIVLVLSLCLNAFFFLRDWINRVHKPTGQIGVLARDVHAGSYSNESVLFTLPKGLTVRDESPRGLGSFDLFEPHHYAIILTTDELDLVDYAAKKKHDHGEFYSVDNRKLKTKKP